jgi:SagB-type dehydrogenase family enzyme
MILVLVLVVLTVAFSSAPQPRAVPQEAPAANAPVEGRQPGSPTTVKLPSPRLTGDVSLEACIQKRRCVRDYQDKALTLAQLGQLLWAANGVTGKNSRFRAAPSAGALHPLDFYAVVGEKSVTGLAAGVWHYEPAEHAIKLGAQGDRRDALAKAALKQRQITHAEVVIVETVETGRTTKKYGARGHNYALMDAGFAAENIFLQVQALGLSMCVVGAFRDGPVQEVLECPREHVPLLFLTIGYPE